MYPHCPTRSRHADPLLRRSSRTTTSPGTSPQMIANTIRERNAFGQQAVLGLPTGSTPVGVYRELIRMHREEGLDLSRRGHVQSRRILRPARRPAAELPPLDARDLLQPREHPAARTSTFPTAPMPPDEVDEHCRRYEEAIRRAGGIDMQLLGIGRNGHIGFNEPFSVRNSRTRLVTLDPVTRKDAASDFFSEENVPTQALTMGIGTIFEARKIMLLAFGEHKARDRPRGGRRADDRPRAGQLPARAPRRRRSCSTRPPPPN